MEKINRRTSVLMTDTLAFFFPAREEINFRNIERVKDDLE